MFSANITHSLIRRLEKFNAVQDILARRLKRRNLGKNKGIIGLLKVFPKCVREILQFASFMCDLCSFIVYLSAEMKFVRCRNLKTGYLYLSAFASETSFNFSPLSISINFKVALFYV